MKLVTLANNRLEKRLQVPMGKAITLPLIVDGVPGEYSVYVTTNAWTSHPPTDQDVVRVARLIADAINKGNPA